MFYKAIRMLLMGSGALLWAWAAVIGGIKLLPPSLYRYDIDLHGTRPLRVESLHCGKTQAVTFNASVAKGERVARCEGSIIILLRYADYDAVCDLGYIDVSSHSTSASHFRIRDRRCENLALI